MDRLTTTLGTPMTNFRQATFSGASPTAGEFVSASTAMMYAPSLMQYAKLYGMTGGSTGRPTLTGALVRDTAIPTTTWRGVVIQMRVSARPDGLTKPYVPFQIYLNSAGGNLGSIFCCPADGREHHIFIPADQFYATAFTVGADTITNITVRDRNDVSAYGYDGLQDGEAAYIGQIYINPKGRAKAVIRFDDGMKHLTTDNGGASLGVANFAADGSTRDWNCLELLNRYGYAGVAGIITARRGLTLNGYAFASEADWAMLLAAGWDIVNHSRNHYSNGYNDGLTLNGPVGYADRAIASVDTGTNIITSTPVTRFGAAGGTNYADITFGGTPPAPLVAGAHYYGRYAGAYTFTVHPTAADAMANTNTIDLTDAGSSPTWRWYGATNDYTGILAEIQGAEADLIAYGVPAKMAQMLMLPQGQWDPYVVQAIAAAGYRIVGGTVSSATKAMGSSVVGEWGVTAGYGNTLAGTWLTVPFGIQTDSATLTAGDITATVQACVAQGQVFQNYHHSLSATNGPKLVAYLDAIKVAQAAGNLDVVTYSQLFDYMDHFVPLPATGAGGTAV